MTGLALPRVRADLPGRHVDTSSRAAQLTRRLNAAAFFQTMLVVCLILIIWPSTFGGRFGIVMVAGSSMEPTYMLGDAVVIWKQPVEVGDTIVYRVPEGDFGAGNPVIHRVVGGNGSGWITQGDGKASPDTWTPSNRDVLGVARFHIPLGGRALAVMGSWLFTATLGGIAAGLLLWPDSENAPDHRARKGRHQA
ncbi:MAG: signal peptidase I [Acidobacteria bacterium]|nr:signal peptidase I [Acidobacteriota bacterium]